MSHNYGYDINRIFTLASDTKNKKLKEFVIRLDNLLHESSRVSSEMTVFLDMIIPLLTESAERYEEGYSEGYTEGYENGIIEGNPDY